jgi:hypothetical protein
VVGQNAMNDLSAREKRARRFEREHEIERRKGICLDASPSQTPTPPPPPQNSLTRKTRLQQSTTFGEGDTVDVTPDLVRRTKLYPVRHLMTIRAFRIGINMQLLDDLKKSSKII